MKYRAFLFDFDGTLVDSMPTFSSAMLRILNESRIVYGDDVIKIVTPLGYAGAAKYFMQLGVPLAQQEIVAKLQEYALADYRDRIPAKRNVVDVLYRLKEKGYSLNVLTASPHSMLDVCLKRIGILDLFEHVWSCEDFDMTKANPEIYVKAAERIGIPIEEILFLDDNYNADACAKTSGIGVCGVYDPSSAEFEMEIKSVSDHYIYDFAELLDLISMSN